MTANPSDEMRAALAEFWALPAPGPTNLRETPTFKRLVKTCCTDYTDQTFTALTDALTYALRALGLPCYAKKTNAEFLMSSDEAAVRLNAAFRAKSSVRRYLVPLDLADDLPSLKFGHSTLRRPSDAELAALVNEPRLRLFYPDRTYDLGQLAQLQWLVVKEDVEFTTEPEARAKPFLFAQIDGDIGQIVPHKNRLPGPVERALFMLLLAPWEEWSQLKEISWCGFSAPVVYRVDDDLFVQPQLPPSTTAFTWQLVPTYDEFGDIDIVYEAPETLPLSVAAARELPSYNQSKWEDVERALGSPMFETPIVHFFVRGFLEDGMDEFLAHYTTIEAALGTQADYPGPARPKPDPHSGLGATKRVKARGIELLDDPTFEDDFDRISELRSTYLHGRRMGNTISTNERILARRLARRVVTALVDAAANDPGVQREKFLDDLVSRGKGRLNG